MAGMTRWICVLCGVCGITMTTLAYAMCELLYDGEQLYDSCMTCMPL